MIPQFVIQLLYVFVLVNTDNSELYGERVTIQLYYESHCPSCKEFLKNSFMSTVTELRSYLDVHLYPYGHAWVQQDGRIACQHGAAECYGNKLHACALYYFRDLAVIFNSCMVNSWNGGSGSDDAAADQCGAHLRLDSGPIKQCAKGPKGEELLAYYGQESKKVHYEVVPTVLINGRPADTRNFRSDVCRSYRVPPEPCRRRWRLL